MCFSVKNWIVKKCCVGCQVLFTFFSSNVHIFSVKMSLSSKINCSTFSSVTPVCTEEVILMKFSLLSLLK